ncbi:uncharacterized protein GIQ15_00726 [Arthroderma uncinatum]|uniref:uncharacterized protein n=1 Tax=Arthroderma uncinatum TaxID=74035 RepID=UPI00144A6011|nr:uncharacterized protein GIQ15_00726 [Arthroderma uncinatum]KAF3491209.1 hypothetical protein GIQ15_00726 [Arthroderma uncinatum]
MRQNFAKPAPLFLTGALSRHSAFQRRSIEYGPPFCPYAVSNLDAIEHAAGDLNQGPQVEHMIKDESDFVDYESQPDTGFLITHTESLPDAVKEPGENLGSEVGNDSEDFQVWFNSLPPSLPPQPFTSGPIMNPSGQLPTSSEHWRASQQPPYTYPERPKALTEPYPAGGRAAIIEVVKPELSRYDIISFHPSYDELAVPFVPMSLEIEPEDGTSMNNPIKDVNRPPSTSNVSPSLSPNAPALKPLEFNTETNSWPLPPLQSASRIFWDPIRDAFREQVRIEKLADTWDWINDLPNITEMLEPETRG